MSVKGGRANKISVRDAGQDGDEIRERVARIDESLKAVDDPALLNLDCADLDDAIALRAQPCGFQVKRDERQRK